MRFRAFQLATLGIIVVAVWHCQHQDGTFTLKDEVCFEREILPVFQASCGTMGCHDNYSRTEGLNLTTYSGISRIVDPGNPGASPAYTVLVSKWERMPPDNPLPESKRQLIRLWILQGAKNSSCPDTLADTGDEDGDGVLNFEDNCPYTSNPDQSDVDNDSIGDLCDDSDNDGIIDIDDNCPDLYNPLQEDDDGDGIGNPCDTDFVAAGIAGVCFERDLYPMFLSSCALSGCHDGSTHEPENLLTDYAHIMQGISPGSPAGSKIYRAVTNTGGGGEDDDRMPPAPYQSLTTLQIDNLKTWIEEGALNEDCGELPFKTEGITFSGDILPIIQNNCRGCHSGYQPEAGLTLLNYGDVAAIAQNGRLENVIKNLYGLQMPPGVILSDNQIIMIDQWIRDGYPDN